MIIGIDIRTLMDARYSGVSEYTLNLVSALLRLDRENEYRLFYNTAKNISERMPKFDYPNVKIVKKSVPNKVLNYFLFKFLNSPKIDKLLGVDPAFGRGAGVFFMPHINFVGLSKRGSASFREAEPLNNVGHKRILTIHDLSFLRYPEFFSARKNFWHKMINVKKIVKKFDKIIAVSENTKRDIVELCSVNPDKVKVIYSGVDKEFKNFQFSILNFQTNPKSKIQSPEDDTNKLNKIKTKYNLPDKFILFLGTIEPRKNIEGLIMAYEILKEKNAGLAQYKLVIAGGWGWKSGNVFKFWKKSRYKNDIKFLGYIDKKDKVYLYNLASLFVYPSFYEGFGFPPLEAMASGVPVVSSFTSSLPEIVGDVGLMVDPYNINDLAVAMEKVLNNDGLRDNLIKRGLEKVKNFSWEKAAREYLEVFKVFRS
jgi:glycosyltransferase involved in cell wall biosynthesis